MSPSSIDAIQAMVAPVVLITSTAILAGGISSMYGSVNDRMRAMTSERLVQFRGDDGRVLGVGELTAWACERVGQIDAQLPRLLRRHRQLHHAALLLYAAVLVFVLAVVAIAIAVTDHSGTAGSIALMLTVAGTVTQLSGLVFAARSILTSQQAIDFEVDRVLLVGGPRQGR